MFEKVIEFIAPKDYVIKKQDLPTPIKINVPDWFKKLNHSEEHRTIIGCIPFLETLTFGYCLYVPVDLKIQHNVSVKDQEGKEKQELDSEEERYIHKGLSGKTFSRIFTLGDWVEVSDAGFKNGMLVVNLQVNTPDAEKPKNIIIG